MKMRTSGSRLALTMAFLAAVFGCERSTEPTASNLGRITILVSPDNAPWTLSGPSYVDSTGDAVLEDMLPGEYTMNWNFCSGYVAPASEELTLLAGGSIRFDGYYIRAGTIIIDPEPDDLDAPWILSGPEDFSYTSTGNDTLSDKMPGTYAIDWDSVQGWITPANEEKTLEAENYIEFQGSYIETGTIVIDPDPNSLFAPWILTGPESFSQDSTGDATLHNMRPGFYTIDWRSIPNWAEPPDEEKTLVEGGSIDFSGTYTESFVLIPEGTFYMGADLDEPGCQGDEWPGHHVTLTKSFTIHTTEVTNQQFMELAQWAVDQGYATATSDSLCDALDGSTVKLLDLDGSNCEIGYSGGSFYLKDAGHGINPTHPIREVAWYGAASYCDWLSLHAGLPRAYDHATWQCNGDTPYTAAGYRLPTEAEWEYACRAGSWTYFNTGDCLSSSSQANFDGTQPFPDCPSGPRLGWTVPVGSYPSNAWGLFDMHGNVTEWCNDWWSDCYYDYDPISDPIGPTSGSYRVRRGGGCGSSAYSCRSAKRIATRPDMGPATGFRPARSAD